MICPVCGSKKVVDDEYGMVYRDVAERRLFCDDCESYIWQRGIVDEWGDVPSGWTLDHIEPSEQGEKLLAEKLDATLMKIAEQHTIPMF